MIKRQKYLIDCDFPEKVVDIILVSILAFAGIFFFYYFNPFPYIYLVLYEIGICLLVIFLIRQRLKSNHNIRRMSTTIIDKKQEEESDSEGQTIYFYYLQTQVGTFQVCQKMYELVDKRNKIIVDVQDNYDIRGLVDVS